MLTYVHTSLFNSPAHTLVNTVNVVGVMGKGIALEFKNRYPEMYKAYHELCKNHALDIGKLHLWRATDHWILNFPTKDTWRRPSRIEYIHSGLEAFCRTYREMGISSISFPPLGCGNGNLDWRDVRPIMESYLSSLDIPVYIHDRQVSKDFVPEHRRNHVATTPISFTEFKKDIVDRLLGGKRHFETLTRSSEFSARWLDNGNIIVERSGKRDVIDHELVEAAWASLQNGILSADQFSGEKSKKLKSYLFPILADLPYVYVAEISRPGWNSQTPAHGLYMKREDRVRHPQRDSVDDDPTEQMCLSL